MPFNVLLLPLLGGYVFIGNWNRTRFRTKRDTGERLLFHAGLAGVVLLVVAFVIVHLLAAVVPELGEVWVSKVPFPYAGTSLLALILGADRAISENRQVSVTLKGGKVYVGFVLENFDPAYDRKYVSILPIASGYRDPAEHRLVLTTTYGEVYLRIRGHRADLAPADFRVVIPVTEVQSANLFDWDAYDEFQSLDELFEPDPRADLQTMPDPVTAIELTAIPTRSARPGRSPPSTHS